MIEHQKYSYHIHGRPNHVPCTRNLVGVAWFKTSDARLLGSLIKDRYGKEGFEDLFWDDVVNENLDKLDLVVHEIKTEQITEIDTVEELKAVDNTYL